jgi:hypothetical protein
MEIYRLALCLLLCSHQLCADSIWSHIPGLGTVQLTELNTEQHLLLAQHLKLNPEETELWLSQLPELLDSFSCSGFEVQSQSLPADIAPNYKVISYAGVLKWFSDDKAKKTVWWLPWQMLPLFSELKVVLTDLNLQLHQPLLLAERQLGQKDQFVLISGSFSPTYFALLLNDPEYPELLWTVSPSDAAFANLTGAMAQPLLLQDHSPHPLVSPLAVLLPNTAAAEQTTLLYKVDLWTGVVQARLDAAQNISSLSGALAIYDQNRDSHLDTLLLGTREGQIWQAQIENNQFYGLEIVADLKELKFSDIQFIRSVYAAVPAGGSGSDFHSRRSQWLLLLVALQQQDSVLVVLKLQSGQSSFNSDLINRTLPEVPENAVFTEHDWYKLQQKHGWYSLLGGRLTQMPIVVAGVLYLSLISSASDQYCDLAQVTAELLALHLHHGSSVYHQPVLPLEKTAGAFAVTTNAKGGFALVETNQRQVLIENLLEISPDCIHCSKAMQQQSFPRWHLMGTYQNEEGAYE